MRKKKVWRYYCDFCKKANCSGASISKHEKHCTLNPERVCGMCKLIKRSQPDLANAVSFLPDPKLYEVSEINLGVESYYFKGLENAVEQLMDNLRDKLDDCPVCIMAALRQRGIPVTMIKSFDYKKESKEELDNYNKTQRRNDEYSAEHEVY